MGWGGKKDRYLALGAIVAVLTVIRLSSPLSFFYVTFDDNPVVYAKMASDPAKWKGDDLLPHLSVMSKASLTTRVIVAAKTELGVPAEITSALVTILANVLVALALLYLFQVAGFYSALSGSFALLAYLLEPWNWNLAAFDFPMLSAYPGFIALGFLIFAIGLGINNKIKEAPACLIVAALIHPTMTAAAVGVLLLFEIFGTRPFALRLLVCLAYGATLLMPALLLALELVTKERVDSNLLVPLLKASGHILIFNREWSMTKVLAYALPLFGATGIMAILSYRRHRPPHEGYRRLARLLPLVLILAALAQVLSVVVGAAFLMQLIPLRASALVPIACLPLVMSFLLSRLDDSLYGERFPVASFFSLQILHPGGLFLGPAIGVIPRRRRWGTYLFWGWLILLVGSFVVGAVFDAKPLARSLRIFLVPNIVLDPITFGLALFVAFSFFWKRFSPRAFFFFAIVLGLLKSLLWVHSGRHDEYALATKEVQVWAKTHTPEGSLFVLSDTAIPWRAFSDRPAMYTVEGPWVLYSRDKQAFEKMRRISAFLAENHAERLESLNEKALRQLSKDYGARYFAVEKNGALPLPLVFENFGFRVYDIEGGAR